MAQGKRQLLAATLATVALSAAVFIATAPEARAKPWYRCGIAATADGGRWAVWQRNTNCAFARYAVRFVERHNRSPRRWRCRRRYTGEFEPQGVISLSCQRDEKRIYAKPR